MNTKPKPEPVSRACPVCGDTYLANPTRLRWGRETTCSRECSYQLRGSKLENSRQIVCALCEREVTRAPSQIKAKHGASYCSRECHYAGRSLGLTGRIVTQPYTYTDDGMRRLRVAGARRYASGGVGGYPESELAVCARLDRAGISYIHQQIFETHDGAIVVDFFFADRATVVEIDGANHRKQDGIDADAKRDAFLASKGIRVIRVPDTGDVCRAVLLALAG
jgi:hypothetical protein